MPSSRSLEPATRRFLTILDYMGRTVLATPAVILGFYVHWSAGVGFALGFVLACWVYALNRMGSVAG